VSKGRRHNSILGCALALSALLWVSPAFAWPAEQPVAPAPIATAPKPVAAEPPADTGDLRLPPSLDFERPPEPPDEPPAPEAEQTEAPEPAEMPTPLPDKPVDDEEEAPLRDDDVERVQSANPLPGATLPPAGGASPAAMTPGLPFMVDASRVLASGPQSVGLTVEVIAPSAMNLRKKATITLVVKNTGPNDAMDVVVRDQVPDGLKFLSAMPDSVSPAGSPIVAWNLRTLPAGTEQRLRLDVIPERIGNYDHIATVSALTAAKASTVVREPKLKVEQTVSSSRVLKGRQVRFDIAVTNTGTGPAQGVVVRAELSSGLKHPQGNVLELALDDPSDLNMPELKPGQTVRLSSLVVDTIGGGEQTCKVDVTSPDVLDESPDAHRVATVTVTEPRLKLTVDGSKTRYTDTIGEYTLTVENPGTAPATNVVVTADLPGDGVVMKPAGSTYSPTNRRLSWSIPALDPGSKPQKFVFQVRLNGVQQYTVNARATATGGLQEYGTCTTQVIGSADVDLEVTEPLRIIDVGQTAVYKIHIKNMGSKEATKMLVTATLSKNIEALESYGTKEQARVDPTTGRLVKFPEIDRLAPGAELSIELKVKATAGGLAKCHVSLMHDDLGDDKIESVETTKVADPRPPSP
jgi:uncharacterized repeat protein (TIGR01451 family)